MRLIWAVVFALAVVLAVVVAAILRGYEWGVQATEARWRDAVQRKHDGEAR